MLVEDNPRYREVIALALKEDAGLHLVSEFGTAEIALRSLQAGGGEFPEVILLDLRLPGMDGLDALPHFLSAAPAARVSTPAASAIEADFQSFMLLSSL